MDRKVFATTFGILFLAELGDKTQLAVLTLAAQTKKPGAVFLGSVAALTAATFLAVVFGQLVDQWIPQNLIRKTAAVVFIIMGIVVFAGKF